MKYFLDSAKLDEIKYAYRTFGIDGVTTNPRHITLSGKPFLEAIQGIADWIREEGLEGVDKFPVSVEINPHLDTAEGMVEAAHKIAAISPNFVIKIPATEAGVTAARALEAEGIRTNVTLIFAPSQAILPAKNGSLFVSPFIGWKEANGEDCKQYIKDIVDIYQELRLLRQDPDHLRCHPHPQADCGLRCGRSRYHHHRPGGVSGYHEARLHQPGNRHLYQCMG